MRFRGVRPKALGDVRVECPHACGVLALAFGELEVLSISCIRIRVRRRSPSPQKRRHSDPHFPQVGGHDLLPVAFLMLSSFVLRRKHPVSRIFSCVRTLPYALAEQRKPQAAMNAVCCSWSMSQQPHLLSTFTLGKTKSMYLIIITVIVDTITSYLLFLLLIPAPRQPAAGSEVIISSAVADIPDTHDIRVAAHTECVAAH